MKSPVRSAKWSEKITWIGAQDFERRIFDQLMPLPWGTTYNSYLVRGSEKTALIDTVEPAFGETLLRQLAEQQVRQLDYVVANHAEQDHSGSLPLILKTFPAAQVLTTPKGKEFLQSLIPLAERRVQTVADGETVSLGDRDLTFIHFPWVHWPETMLTYCPQEKTLFSCDLYGSHLASDRLFDEADEKVLAAARLYYAQIMMPFAAVIKKNLEKLAGREVAVIAPSHGPIHSRPALIEGAYRQFLREATEDRVLLAYVSMHGSTQAMADHLAAALARRQIPVTAFDLGQADLGQFAAALISARTLLFGAGCVITGLHPKALFAAQLTNLLKPKARWIGLFGSFGWAAGKMVEQFQAATGNLKAEPLPPVIGRGHPTAETLSALEQLAETIAERHRSISE